MAMLLLSSRSSLALGIVMSRQLDGTILYWSRGAAAFYGWPRREATGEKRHTLLATVFPVDLVAIEAGLYMTGQWSGSLVHTARVAGVMMDITRLR